MTKVAVGAEGIARSSFRTRALAWNQLEKLTLRYFGTRRQHRGGSGFMVLTLGGPPGSMSFESDLEGFDDVARRAAAAAKRNGVSLDPASAGNLLALGVDPDDEASSGRRDGG